MKKGLNLCPARGLQLHLITTRCLSEWGKSVYGKVLHNDRDKARAWSSLSEGKGDTASHIPVLETIQKHTGLLWSSLLESEFKLKQMFKSVLSPFHQCSHANFSDLMASESMWTGAIRSNRNFTISRNGLVGCLGNVNFRVISLCREYKQHHNILILVILCMLLCMHIHSKSYIIKTLVKRGKKVNLAVILLSITVQDWNLSQKSAFSLTDWTFNWKIKLFWLFHAFGLIHSN